MVVDILIYIEGSEYFKSVCKVYLTWNQCIAFENWQEVRSADHQVKVNNGHDPVPFTIKVRLNDPHACVRVRVVKGFTEVVDKGT